MPDQYEFDHLSRDGGPFLRCIHCGEGGSPWAWGEARREAHFQQHEAERREAARLARQAEKERQSDHDDRPTPDDLAARA